MVEAKLLRKKLKNGLIVDKWDLVTIIEKQQAEIAELETGLKNVWKVVEGKQTEIDRLNYDMEGFKQNFFVSGFHLQIKMANEQLVKQQEQIDALKSELDRAVELYTDKAIKVEQLEKELTEAGHMIGVLREYISDLEKGLESSIKLNKAQAERKT
jgi:peptidoglycan hydrolase CwlO-like protein